LVIPRSLRRAPVAWLACGGWINVRDVTNTLPLHNRPHLITLRHQGGRKQVVTPAGATPWISTPRRVDNTLVKAIVRAHRWRDMLESGRHATVRDLAKAEVINESYLGRILRLTLLSPSIVEAILEGRQPPTLELDSLLKQFPVACH
jgi:hypothetical protein